MIARAAASAAVLLCLVATPAHAHRVIEGVGGFAGGVLHPLLALPHTLALIAVALLAGAQSPKRRFLVVGIFIASFAFSCALIALAFSAANAELAVLALAALTGLPLAANIIRFFPVAAALTASAACAIVFDSVPAVPSVSETVAALAGTALTATALVAMLAYISAALPDIWQRIGIRIAGSWIAASAIMVLALRFSP